MKSENLDIEKQRDEFVSRYKRRIVWMNFLLLLLVGVFWAIVYLGHSSVSPSVLMGITIAASGISLGGILIFCRQLYWLIVRR